MISLYQLNLILDDLSKYKHSKEELNVLYLQKRLDKCLNVYYNQLNKDYEYLLYKDNMKVIKAINKED